MIIVGKEWTIIYFHYKISSNQADAFLVFLIFGLQYTTSLAKRVSFVEGAFKFLFKYQISIQFTIAHIKPCKSVQNLHCIAIYETSSCHRKPAEAIKPEILIFQIVLMAKPLPIIICFHSSYN